MNASEFQGFRDQFGLTTEQLARLFDVTGRAVRKWLAGDAPVPGTVVLLIQIIRLFSDVREWLNIETPTLSTSTLPVAAARSRVSAPRATRRPKKRAKPSRRTASRP